jgi:hypothetical protein
MGTKGRVEETWQKLRYLVLPQVAAANPGRSATPAEYVTAAGWMDEHVTNHALPGRTKEDVPPGPRVRSVQRTDEPGSFQAGGEKSLHHPERDQGRGHRGQGRGARREPIGHGRMGGERGSDVAEGRLVGGMDAGPGRDPVPTTMTGCGRGR